MDEHRERVLLTLHPKVGRWLQLGGHCEPDDASLREAARREAIEESGIDEVLISTVPIRLDRHQVPCAGAMSEHLDVQYLATVRADACEVMSDESDDLRWFQLSGLPEDLDGSVRALILAAMSPRASEGLILVS
jgi:8-oxo-dGTP pyrophosphatase MutT (NUDIX family)